MAKKVKPTSNVTTWVKGFSEDELDELNRRNLQTMFKKLDERVMKKNLAMYHTLSMFLPITLPKRPCHDFLPLKKLKTPTTQKELVRVIAAQLQAEDKAKGVDRKEDKAVIDVIDYKIAQLTKRSINRKKELAKKKQDECSAEETNMDNYEEEVWDFFTFLRVIALKLCKRRYLIREDVGRYLVSYDNFERIIHRGLARMDYREPTLQPLIMHIKNKIKSLHSAHFFEDKEKSEELQFHKYLVEFTRRGLVLDTTDIEPDFANWYANDYILFEDEIERYKLGLKLLERAMDKLILLSKTLDIMTEPDQEVEKKPGKK